MEIAEYSNIETNEGSHFFYVGLHDLVESIVDSKFVGKSRARVLDAGSGTGSLALKLSRIGKVYSVDNNRQAVRIAKKKGLNTILSGIERLPFKDNYFDLITCIDVLVSVKNDLAALKELYRVCKPGGVFVFRVSANSWLKTNHDEVVHMLRRYSRTELMEKLKLSGWKVEKVSYMNMILVAPLLFTKIFLHGKTGSNIGKVHPNLNKILILMQRIENRILKSYNLPFGIGLFAVVNKPEIEK